MPEYDTTEHDVLVIGAGGAGLRAAIEASAAGVTVGLVCKSLLGKAHTVMAEGGIAAALANVDDRTGLEMIRTLQDHGIHRGIDVHMECTIVRLLEDGGRVVGAFGYERERGRFKLFRARAIVLATGGVGRAYKITSNSWEYTGDGHTLAYDAGAELVDMEFVQFHPTGMVWPQSVSGILVTEGVRGEGGILTNSQGRRFMFDDIPEAYRAQ